MTLAAATTRTIHAPGATLTYDLRTGSSSEQPPLFIIGSPMGASGFGTLAGHFPERTVVTYDPRGVERSAKDDPTSESKVEEHADDLHRIIQEVGGLVDLFASSGGAVNALALVARHPEDVRTLVAHEPPATSALPDAKHALAACRDIRATYLRDGFGTGMAKFIGLVSHQGPITADYLRQPAPDPAMFGLPADDDGSRTDPLLGQNMVTCNAYQHDFAALRAASTRVIIAAGEETAEALPRRAAIAVGEQLGQTPVTFPGGHDGFLGGEYGQTGKPDAFAAKLHEVLEEAQPEI